MSNSLGRFASAALALLLLLSGSASPAAPGKEAPGLTELERHKSAELELWRAMDGMYVRRALLVAEKPSSFGVYTPRTDNRYRAGEPVHIYVEPVAHTVRETEGLFTVSLAVDFTLLDGSGKILGGQRDFDRLEVHSRSPLLEFMTHFTYETDGLPAGRYVFETLLRDSFSGRRVKVALPVVIVEQP